MELASLSSELARLSGPPMSVQLGSYSATLERVASGFADVGLLWGPQPAPREGLVAEMVGADGLAVVVNPRNQVGPLVLEDVRSLFNGATPDWWTFGQGMGAVEVVTRESGSGLRLSFDDIVMEGVPVSAGAVVAASDDAVLDYVAAHPAAVGYVAASNLREGVRALTVEGERPEPQRVREGHYRLMASVWLIYREGEAATGLIDRLSSPEGVDVLSRYLAPVDALAGG